MRVRFEDFSLDTERRELTRGADAVHLTPKAFDLLALLVERRPRAVSQNDLFDHLWPDTLVDLSRIHQLIQELREALGDDERRVVRTVYGRGYSFASPAVTMDELPASRYQLILGSTTHELREGSNVIGRDFGSAVRIDHPSVSRRHAQVVVDRDRVTVDDLGSRNGTFVNEGRIRSSAPLAHGDLLKFGDVPVSFIVLTPPPSTQ